MDRAQAIQSFSAVTAACLVVRESAVPSRLGGLNEVELKIAYNDVDFCLGCARPAIGNVWTPSPIVPS